MTFKQGDVYIAKNAMTDPSNLFETVGHEYGHQVISPAGFSLNREHLMIYDILKRSEYSNFWSSPVTNKLQENYSKHVAGWLGTQMVDMTGEWY